MSPPATSRSRASIHTRSVDEARAIYSRLRNPVVIDGPTRRGPFEWRSTVRRLGGVAIAASRFGGGIQARSDSVTATFGLSLAVGDASGQGSSRGETIPVVRGDSGLFSSPGDPIEVKLAAGFRGLELAIDPSLMESALLASTGESRLAPLRFEPQLALAGAKAAASLRLIQFLYDELGHDDGALASPLVAARMTDALVYTLLSAQPHNHLARLQQDGPKPAPRSVHKVEEHIAAHAGEPIGMADLARVSGVGVRSLQAAFRTHRGCSPTAFLRARRLELARARLLRAAPGTTVSEIALACGFAHFGRFSRDYRARFGESPSRTKRAG